MLNFAGLHIRLLESTHTNDTATAARAANASPSTKRGNIRNPNNKSNEPNMETKIEVREEHKVNIKATIGYAISLTGCGDDLTDGGAVLKHSIHLSSSQNPMSGSRYDYKMIAIVHPAAMECSKQLEALGYKLLVRDVPVPVEEIKGDFLRERVVNNGCCGEKEFIKLWAYSLVEYPAVVHLDLDTLVLKPMDNLFDAMLDGPTSAARANIPVMFGEAMPDAVDAYFTRDYNMAHPGSGRPVGVQGGFLVLRPSQKAFEDFKDIIREGDFRSNGGWGGKGYAFYGAMTFQGIVPYYYDFVRPDTHTELSRCIYNAQADNPRTLPSHSVGNCRDGQLDCEDCRGYDIDPIVTAHYTLCQKPWNCLPHSMDDIRHRLCRKLHHEWYRIRADLEDEWYAKTKDQSIMEKRTGKFQSEHFYGFCKSSGVKGYIRMGTPPKL